MLTLFILSYTLGAVVTYGAIFAYWQGKYGGDIAEDFRISLFFGIVWPAGVLVAFANAGRKPFQSGLKFY